MMCQMFDMILVELTHFGADTHNFGTNFTDFVSDFRDTLVHFRSETCDLLTHFQSETCDLLIHFHESLIGPFLKPFYCMNECPLFAGAVSAASLATRFSICPVR